MLLDIFSCKYMFLLFFMVKSILIGLDISLLLCFFYDPLQKFYESLSSKARPKPRSLSQSPSRDEDLGQRLEAKLQAAEQKRYFLF